MVLTYSIISTPCASCLRNVTIYFQLPIIKCLKKICHFGFLYLYQQDFSDPSLSFIQLSSATLMSMRFFKGEVTKLQVTQVITYKVFIKLNIEI